MSSFGGYPLGAEYDRKAPWKEKEPKQIEVEVCVTVCYNKTVTVKVPEDYNNTDLFEAASEKVWDELNSLTACGWIEDEFDVTEE